jgi:hypothetical protein
VGTRIEKTGIGWKEKKEGAKCDEERETIENMWNGWSEMGERERTERCEILGEDGRKIIWMKEIWKRRERIEKGRGRDRKKGVFFWNCDFNCFLLSIRNH